MKIVMEMGIEEFEAWSGAIDTKNRIVECNKCAEFDSLIDELYPDGLSDGQLNDILWHEDSWVYDSLGISEDDEDDEDDENDEDDEY